MSGDTQTSTPPGRSSFAALILGLSLIASAAIWSAAFYRAKALDNTMGVTGSVRKRVSSDVVKWTSGFTRTTTVDQMGAMNERMKTDLAAVLAFLGSRGIAEKDVTISPLSVEPIFRGGDGSPSEYTLRQTIQLSSGDVAGVTQIAKDASSLMSEGILFATQSLEYYVSNLPELRVQMLAGAIQDARARATAIAEASGGRLGRLRSASAGVTQVLQVNSMEISDYGAYDTSTIEKEVVATVRASFVLK